MRNILKNKLIKLGIYCAGLIYLLVGSVLSAQAASLYLSPQSGTYKVGDVFSVNVFASSPGQAMNAAEVSVFFDPEKLSAVGTSNKLSIFSLLFQDPSLSNQSGLVTFSGIILNPGYIGSAGRLITISFEAKTEGTTKIGFNNAEVLANDGSGTSILNGTSNASINILAKESKEKLIIKTPAKPPTTKTAPAKATPASKVIPIPTATPAVTTTPISPVPILASPAAPTPQYVPTYKVAPLPTVFVKIGGYKFGNFQILLVFLLFLMMVSFFITIYSFVEVWILERKRSKKIRHHRK